MSLVRHVRDAFSRIFDRLSGVTAKSRYRKNSNRGNMCQDVGVASPCKTHRIFLLFCLN